MELHTRDRHTAARGISILPRRRGPSMRTAIVAGFVSWHIAARRRSQALKLAKTLYPLDDRMLRDIGIQRHQIEEFARQVYDQKPTAAAVRGG